MQKAHEEKRLLTASQYYELARQTAREKRSELGIATKDISIPVLKKICKKENIKVDLVEKIGSNIRAAYFFDNDGCSILLKKDLPREPKLFALAHELKHHFLDRELIASGKMQCGDYNKNKEIEIAAEIFAAEFIFPEDEMRSFIESMGIKRGSCTAEDIVRVKRNSPVSVSYVFIYKRLCWFGIIDKGQYSDVQFLKLEERMYPPFYKEAWFKRARARKKLARGY